MNPVRRAWRAPLAAAVTLGAVATAGLLTAGAASGGQPDLNRVRQATAKYHTVAHTGHGGYVRFLECMDDGVSKGMGQHYVNMALLGDNGALDATTPEALVYDESSGKARLVALEYIVPGPPDMAAPHLLGQTFTYLPSLGVWKLHYWIWRTNPDGIFKDYNASVPLCSAGTGMAMQH